MALAGNEILYVQGIAQNGQPSGILEQTTTAAVAALATAETSFVSTSITTAGAGVLTAAGLVGTQIVRTGPSANYSDATDTATAIVAAFPGGLATGSNIVNIKNATAYTQTITAGTGVTLPLTAIIPPFSVGRYAVVPTSTTAITLTHIQTVPITVGQNSTAPAFTALSTVGAGVITAAGFAGGLTNRGGAQSATAFTDTTDTAANIIAAAANLVNKIGASFVYRYVNNTNGPATITGGTGVTVSGITLVPANAWADFVLTYTAAATITMVGVGSGYLPQIGTFTANGATGVVVSNTAVSPNSNIVFTAKTIGGTPAGAPFLSSVTPGTGFTVKAIAGDTSVYNYAILG